MEERNNVAVSREKMNARLRGLNPAVVLSNLSEYCNTQDLSNKQVIQIGRRFVSYEEFNSFKHMVSADEERKTALVDIGK